ncbi:Metallopeptidase, catalytic domain protein [Cordyceps fumosorosea ARSEF 2679]|uniref:Metallopeptidase, catalytic domain protein n=1 Tax=Cordyceps fumosorosea (strain ARSEF 2679) TaxID=1081104 RepID=A0A167LJ68_CORFA|nr:Metallopeptidase, catalytic domain protein [Cordyceps fumosorosea ARSEF 2679]OAA53144.1 Metallopeptidase, catalytic domain protein [Cordyceps fumosorosea ARSEF 2679]
MKLIGIIALQPAAVMAAAVGGGWPSLEDRAEPSIFQSLAKLGPLNSTGCVVNEDGASNFARAETEGSCTSQQQQVDQGLALCVKRARAAKKAVKDGSPLFEQYFKTNDSGTLDEVAEAFGNIAIGCDKNGNKPIRVVCSPAKRCTLPQTGNAELAAIATTQGTGESSIELCRGAFTMGGGGRGRQRRQAQGGRRCADNLIDIGDLFVHEMSHSTGRTGDVVYGKQGALGLTTNKALNNADSFALFAQDVSGACAAEPGSGTQPPDNGNDGNQRPPDNGDGGNQRPPDNGIDLNQPPPNHGSDPNQPPLDDGNEGPISGGNDTPPKDSPGFDNGGDKEPGDGSQPPNIGDGVNEEPPNDEIGENPNDQIGGNPNDQIGGDLNDEVPADLINEIIGNIDDQNFGGDQTGGDQFGGDQSGGDQFGGDQFGGDQFAGDQFGGDQFGGDQSGGDQFGGDQFGGEQLGSDQFSGEQFRGDQFGGDQFGGDQFGGDQSGGDQSGGDFGGGANNQFGGNELFGGDGFSGGGESFGGDRVFGGNGI